VDYARILERAETEAEVIVWDGGNNDLPFYAPDLHICVADPHRPGHESSYFPGEANFRRADVIVINKCDSADEARIRAIEEAAARLNPRARVIRAESPVVDEHPDLVRGRRVIVIEDGPTLTHGGMSYGAGFVAASRDGALEIVDPSPHAVGSIRETYRKYPNAAGILPAMGYSPEQIRELEQTIQNTPSDVVVSGTPIDLTRVLRVNRPLVRVRYELKEVVPGGLAREVREALAGRTAPEMPAAEKRAELTAT
jgi:predicted GTPase